MLTVQRPQPAMINQIMALISGAQRRMAEIQIDQWQDGYPDRAQIESDIRAGAARAFMEDDQLAGYAALVIGLEPAYEALRGKWLLPCAKYASIHRMAMNDGFNGRGLGAQVIDALSKEAAQAGCDSVRADTHRGNFPMRRLLERNGFIACGECEYESTGDPVRVAYEKILK